MVEWLPAPEGSLPENEELGENDAFGEMSVGVGVSLGEEAAVTHYHYTSHRQVNVNRKT
jgi:hypothetical protein